MKTTVKFLKDRDTKEVFAYFPNQNYDEQKYGSSQKVSYSSGEFCVCPVDYSLECAEANQLEYSDLLKELETMGYNDLTVINELKLQVITNNTYKEALNKLSKSSKDFESFSSGQMDAKFKK